MIMRIMRKGIHDALHTVDVLLTCIIREDLSDEEFEVIKDMTDRIEHTIHNGIIVEQWKHNSLGAVRLVPKVPGLCSYSSQALI